MSIIEDAKRLFAALDGLSVDEKVETINQIKIALHEHSPMSAEPVDCVLWVKSDTVHANDYNPNSVATPEMELLRHSIREDGYTQPIVVYPEKDKHTVVDGFHRNRVGKECPDITERLHGYLPVTRINSSRSDKGDRVSSTIRHNRARGKHSVQAMSEIVVDLARRNWTDAKIAKELGMDPDEVLRLKQITGLTELFADRDFSEAWDAE